LIKALFKYNIHWHASVIWLMLTGMNEHGGVAVLVAIFNAANTVHGHGRRCERNERATHARARKPPLPDNQRTRAPLQDRPACAERIRFATEISRKTHDRPAYRPTPAREATRLPVEGSNARGLLVNRRTEIQARRRRIQHLATPTQRRRVVWPAAGAFCKQPS